MAELLLEIFSEEIPARLQNQAVVHLNDLFVEQAKKFGLIYKQINCYATPRRLVLVVDSVDQVTNNDAVEKKGPRVDAPAEAIVGFLKTNNIAKQDLIVKEIKGQEFYFANIVAVAQNIHESITQIINHILNNFPWPKTMRWDKTNVKWTRPIRNILCIFGGKILPINFGNLVSNNASSGHRFMMGHNFAVENFAEYAKQLAIHKVILDPKERRKMVLVEASRLASELNLKLLVDDNLLDEIVGLVEYPVCLLGKIDQEFLEVPKEVLIGTMKTHQKYFALLSQNDDFAPYFIVVSNIESKNPQQIISGNEKVLRARLYDAKFFYEQDKKLTLDSRVDDLKKVVFHADLGTLFEKTDRIVKLSKEIAGILGLGTETIEKAARLSKADLTTNLVKEFPELQGTIGKYYALHDGEDTRVANAIAEHYLPAGKSDHCPQSIEGAIVSIADKLDSIVGLFLIGKEPTSSKDPYALRRSALGIIRIIIEHELNLNLDSLVLKSLEFFLDSLEQKRPGYNTSTGEVEYFKETNNGFILTNNEKMSLTCRISSFFDERFTFLLKNEFRHDFIAAVTHLNSFYYDYQRIVILKEFHDSDKGKEVFAIFRRIANFIPANYAKSDPTVNPELFSDELEKKLYEVVSQVTNESKEVGFFTGGFFILSKLVEPVNNFCDKVTVMSDDENIKTNRINLLRSVQNCVSDFQIDFSAIEF